MIPRTLPVRLTAKVAFLRRPDSYPAGVSLVEAIETHMAWVFLAGERAYKLKKPVRYPFLDFSTLDARRHLCLEEVRLNRRLSPHVYLGTMSLTADDDRNLHLGGDGEPVEWLVVMRRLPRERMLDAALAAGRSSDARVEPVARLLADFFANAPPEPQQPEAYLARLREDVAENRSELLAHVSRDQQARVRSVARGLEAFLRRDAALLADRVRHGKVVEGHGDLRPEHVFLGPPPAVIDSIEFNRSFRILDPADELSFLGLELERLEAPGTGALFLRVYRERTGDNPPERLLAFYAAHRGLLRAKIAIWHLTDDVPDPYTWVRRCATYLKLAARHTEHFMLP